MNIQVHHVVVHTPEQVRAIIAEAALIASEEDVEGVSPEVVFHEACVLLAARHSLAVAPQGPPLDLGALGLNHRGH